MGTVNLSLSKLFEVMEAAKEKFGVEDYSVSQTTLDQVNIPLDYSISQTTLDVVDIPLD